MSAILGPVIASSLRAALRPVCSSGEFQLAFRICGCANACAIVDQLALRELRPAWAHTAASKPLYNTGGETMRKRAFLMAAFVSAACLNGGVSAQTYPVKPIRILVGFAP